MLFSVTDEASIVSYDNDFSWGMMILVEILTFSNQSKNMVNWAGLMLEW